VFIVYLELVHFLLGEVGKIFTPEILQLVDLFFTFLGNFTDKFHGLDVYFGFALGFGDSFTNGFIEFVVLVTFNRGNKLSRANDTVILEVVFDVALKTVAFENLCHNFVVWQVGEECSVDATGDGLVFLVNLKPSGFTIGKRKF
jgi:hypothetical protein